MVISHSLDLGLCLNLEPEFILKPGQRDSPLGFDKMTSFSDIYGEFFRF